MRKLGKTLYKEFLTGLKNGELFGVVGGGILDVLGLKKYCECPAFKIWCEMLDNYAEYERQMMDLVNDALLAKCSDGSLRVPSELMDGFISRSGNLSNLSLAFIDTYLSYLELYKSKLVNAILYDLTVNMACKGIGAIGKAGVILKNSKNTTQSK